MAALIEINTDGLAKFANTISFALGGTARGERKMAEAKAYAKELEARTNNNVAFIELQGQEALANYVAVKENRRFKNTLSVVEKAHSYFVEGEEVSNAPIDPDWVTRLFDIVQDISNEQMQDLWGRILAGEVKRPQSYSLRSLEALRNITSDEACLFERMAQYVLYDGMYFIYRDSFENVANVNIRYADIAKLIEIGFVQAGSMVEQNYYNKSEISVVRQLFYCGKYISFLNMPADVKQMSFPIYPLTTVGEELYKLISVKPNIDYYKQVLCKIKERNKKLSIKYAKLKRVDFQQGNFEYYNNTIKEI